MVFDVRRVGDYVSTVDAKIRRIKERYRSVKVGLSWSSTPSLVKDLVAYVVSRIKVEGSAVINQDIASKELYSGKGSDFKKEFCLRFEDSCKVYDNMDNTSNAQSIPCIVFYQCNNVIWLMSIFEPEIKAESKKGQDGDHCQYY
jgi:ABC-type sulfate transport system substrate-binding protein